MRSVVVESCAEIEAYLSITMTKNDSPITDRPRRLTVGSGECPVIWREDYNNRAEFDAIIEIDHVLIGHADAARGDGSADIFGLVGAVDPVLRVLATRE